MNGEDEPVKIPSAAGSSESIEGESTAGVAIEQDSEGEVEELINIDVREDGEKEEEIGEYPSINTPKEDETDASLSNGKESPTAASSPVVQMEEDNDDDVPPVIVGLVTCPPPPHAPSESWKLWTDKQRKKLVKKSLLWRRIAIGAPTQTKHRQLKPADQRRQGSSSKRLR